MCIRDSRKANCCKQYVHQRYHQQQANEWQVLLNEQIGEQKTQEMLAQLSSVLAQANRSSSMIETINSRLKPYLKGCLLYTSPSPRDRTRYRMPSSA